MEEKIEFSNTLVFYVNGKRVEDSEVNPEWTLLTYLRNKLKLCGTKLGCGEGGCGACTVMVSKYDRKLQKEVHLPVNACLAPICSVHGHAVITVEGIGSTKTKLHPVQERIAKAHGSQCGFCTPGIVMSMYTLIRQTPKPNMKDLEIAFQGNLCRCTGYRPILEGYKTFTEEWEIMQQVGLMNGGGKGCRMGDQCCKVKKNGITNGNGGVSNGTGSVTNGSLNGDSNHQPEKDEQLFKPSEFLPYHPSQEPIFPPELKLFDKYDRQYLLISNSEVTWHRPTTLNQLISLKTKHPDAKLVVGNTEIGVEVKFKHMVYPVLIQPSLVPELIGVNVTPNGVRVGASTTLIDMENELRKIIKEMPEEKTRLFLSIVEMLHWFAGKQIRSVGSIGSNIMTGSPISDMLPILMAARVKLEVQNAKGSRVVTLDDKFFTGYRKTIILPDEILIAINLPFTNNDHHVYSFKQARRRDDDIAIVNISLNVKFEPKSNIIEDLSLAFGGMSFKTVTAPLTQKTLKGMVWNKSTIEKAFDLLLEDLPLDPGAPGGNIQYRKSLPLSLFFKGYLAISQKLQTTLPNITKIDKREISGATGFHAKDLKSSQYFTVVAKTQEKTNALQRPIVHASAFKQASGEAVYCDDIPKFADELYMAFVLSTEGHAKVISIDASEALKMKGVHGIFTADDVPKDKLLVGTIVHDEKVFYSDEVTAQGQIVAAIVGDDQLIAQKAARKVKVTYEKIEPVIVTIEDAIKHNSFFASPHKIIKKGDVEEVFKTAPHVIEGEARMGGQEHFYLETQAVIAVPKREDYEMEIYSSTQNPTELAKLIAYVLGVPQNRIICKVKRLGGGFGGKESKSVIVGIPAAVAASKLNRPIRVMLDRDEDIVMTGGRNPFLMKYKAAFDDMGKILGVEVNLYNNSGYSVDLSPSLLERAMTHFTNAYYIPNAIISGHMCKTNLPSNTAFRGFGGPQGMYGGESIIQQIADYLKKDSATISKINLIKDGQKTTYNQVVSNCSLDKCWRECVKTSDYFKRKKECEKFNRENRFKKRGLSLMPTMYGIAFTAVFLNQGGALILVYVDGSVLLTHGGTEMGQGLYTKTIQVASSALGISPEKIHISETATDKVPNTSPTAASTGSDLNGMAVLDACLKIVARLKPYKEANPNGTWEEWVHKAYYDRVSLSATGFHKTPDIGYNWDTGVGNMFNYFVYGVACTEVEIDTLTGDHQVLKTDIVMDIGESINPAIDIGQIEGAFMQGYGLFVLEEMVYSPTGTTYTRGPGTYKIPGFADIPGEFNVSLLKGVSNPRAVYSSKAVGEPPLFLACSAFYAILDAIKAARIENGVTPIFRLDAPATAAKIRMACHDSITSKLVEPEVGSYKPWNIIA